MNEYHFKINNTHYNFEELIVVDTTTGSWWKIKYEQDENAVFRRGNSGWARQSPSVTKAYLDYNIDKLFVG